MRNFLVFCTGMVLSVQFLLGQIPEKSASPAIYESLQKLNFLGNALYIAAHPDDENTRLISYLSNEVKARTGYLAVTRGDGGQNLIGPELRELLGVLRTQELLAARRVDGGEQFFTRAVDFGYSKHPRETLKIWDKEAVLGDMVWIIRNFRPDVIINRFDHRSPGTTHGHHTSSAILSTEAFDLAGDPNAYPGQLAFTDTWQPRREFFNTSWWFYGSQELFEKADKSKMMSFDVGVYYPLKGMSNNEIASLASSQHLCQGFGRLSSRGSEQEYVELIKGDMPKDQRDLFEGIDTSWSRMEGGKAVGEILYAIENNFNFRDPSTHLPQLLEAHKKLVACPEGYWKRQKLGELQELIVQVCGLYLDANTEVASACPGDTVSVSIEAVNRSKIAITLNSVSLTETAAYREAKPLADNARVTFQIPLEIAADTPYTSPYWLTKKGSLGNYEVQDQELVGRPETPPAYNANFELSFNGYPIVISKPVIYKYARPDKGEIKQPFNILPQATAKFNDPVLIFANGQARKIPLTIRANKDELSGTASLEVGDGWKVSEASLPFEIGKKGDEKTLVFTLIPPNEENENTLRPIITVNGKTFSKELVTIAYDHIPTQTVLLPAETKLVRLNIQKEGEHVGYIVGAGDQVPESLRQIGYTVHEIDPTTIGPGSLDVYDAVVVGIRAYNVVNELKFKQPYLLDYAKKGGTLIVQYNTVWRNNDLGVDNLAPYDLEISRDRVSEEDAEVGILAPGNPLMQFPNQITKADFNGWVQERGLYFPDAWDKSFTPLLTMHDEGEDPKEGGLLVAPYGRGYYIYTGLSFFRELPAGVPGAFKLFANMLSVGKSGVQNENAVKG